jgi:hypothetical protein
MVSYRNPILQIGEKIILIQVVVSSSHMETRSSAMERKPDRFGLMLRLLEPRELTRRLGCQALTLAKYQVITRTAFGVF